MDGFMTYERIKTSKGDSFRIVGEENAFDGILVLDTETTGLEGAPKDVVVDVGICRVDLRRGTVEDVYSSVLGYDTSEWDDYLKNAWILRTSAMTDSAGGADSTISSDMSVFSKIQAFFR